MSASPPHGSGTGPRASDCSTYLRILAHARGSSTGLAAMLPLTLLGPAVALLYPLPLKIAIDSVLGSHPLPSFLLPLVPTSMTTEPAIATLALAAGLLVAIAVLGQLQRLASAFVADAAGARLTLDLRARIFLHVQRLSLAYHDSAGSADSTHRLMRDASAVADVVIRNALPLAGAAAMFVALLYVTWRLDPALAAVAVAISPILLLLSGLYRPRLREQWRELKRAESAVMGVAQEVLGALRVVKAFGSEEREQQRLVHRSREGLGTRLRLLWLRRQLGSLVGLTLAAGQAAVLVIGVLHVRTGVLTLGELLVVMAYMRRLYDPLRTAAQKLADLQGSLASAERVFELLDQAPDVPERPDARPLGVSHGDVSFRHVAFGYAAGTPALADVSLDIAHAERVCIVGRSGAGKTTLVNLLCRFYDPAFGTILLDGIDLREYRLADLRRQFSVVQQEPVLFATSIAENIAYARPDATHEAIVAAANAANAHDFITAFPQGYATAVGERGMTLSGGQRQRIALARAFLRDAPILILDEPTSAVDPESEAAIVDAIARLMQGRTTLLIAHRPPAGMVERVVRIDNGRVAAVTARALSETTGSAAANDAGASVVAGSSA